MLLFRTRPDDIFQDIVREALAWLKDDLTRGETDPKVMTAELPKTGSLLTVGPALATVDELLMALNRTEMYDLTPMHRLILSEALERYGESFNDQPQDTDVHQRYAIHEVDTRRMQALFLAPIEPALRETPAQARTEALQLVIIGDAPWRTPIPQDLSPWYRKDEVYPACPSEE